MPENETASADAAEASGAPAEAQPNTDTQLNTEAQTDTDAQAASIEDITYHAVEKDGQVAAIWEMQGRKHLRTIDPRSRLGQEILRLYTADHPEEASA